MADSTDSTAPEPTTTDTSAPAAPVLDQSAKASFVARTSKAFGAGIGGAVSAGGAALTVALPDGITSAEAWTIAGATLGGFVVAFAAAYSAPANK